LISTSFATPDLWARAWAKQHSAKLIVSVSEDLRSAIRNSMFRVFDENIPPDEAADLIRPLIGLTEGHAEAVLKLRRTLQDSPGRVVWAGAKRIQVPAEGASRAFLQRQTEAYADRLLSWHADAIARTETLAASNEGQRLLWMKSVAEGNLRVDEQRKWIAHPRCCDLCAQMNGQVRGLEEPFTTPDGDQVMSAPAHPFCRCAQGLVIPTRAAFAAQNVLLFDPEPRDAASQHGKAGTAEYFHNYYIAHKKGGANDATAAVDPAAVSKNLAALPEHQGAWKGGSFAGLVNNPIQLAPGVNPTDTVSALQTTIAKTLKKRTKEFSGDLPMKQLVAREGIVEDVPIASLHTFQTWVGPHVIQKVAAGTWFDKGDWTKPHALIYRHQGIDVILDGNHRVATRLLSGKHSIRVTRLPNPKEPPVAAPITHAAARRDVGYQFSSLEWLDEEEPAAPYVLRDAASTLGIPFKGGTAEYHRAYNALKKKGQTPGGIASQTPLGGPAPPAPSGPSGVLDTSSMKQIGGQAGSNPGGLYQAADGTQYYIKTGKSEAHIGNELAAGDLYREAGIATPDLFPALRNGAPAVASKILPTENVHPNVLSTTPGVADGFAADAWLANWDVVGLGFDNLKVSGGKALRLDTGGALSFRAQGAPKGAAFGTSVGEFTSMRNPTTAAQAAHVFKGMTPEQLRSSVGRVTKISDDRIRQIIKKRGLPSELAEKLIARKADLAGRAASLPPGGLN